MVYGTSSELVTGANLNQRSHHWGAPHCRDHDERPYNMAIVLSMDAFGHGNCYGENPWINGAEKGATKCGSHFQTNRPLCWTSSKVGLYTYRVGWLSIQYIYIYKLIYIYIEVTRIYTAIMCGFPLDG